MWVGGPIEAALLKLRTWSLLIFTFFMISDPRSTPNSRLSRLIFGAATAFLGIYLQLAHGIAAGLIISLVFISLMTPLLDKIFPAEIFEWKKNPDIDRFYSADSLTSG
jgi:Na+-translocating ferredoxin:NAD+ oxidoreductase RnfD subunit